MSEVSFRWWILWSWTSMIIVNLLVLTEFILLYTPLYYPLIIIPSNTLLMLSVLRFNKYSFIIATLLGGPILWVINGFYLMSRWNHPKINK